jgi:hypothetical protein
VFSPPFSCLRLARPKLKFTSGRFIDRYSETAIVEMYAVSRRPLIASSWSYVLYAYRDADTCLD